MRNRAFTILETIVVIAVIALLISVILPALLSSKAAARELGSIATVSNICNIGFGRRPPITYRANGEFRSTLTMWGEVNARSWVDPFRTTSLSNDATLAPLGTIIDKDFPPLGLGYFFINFKTSSAARANPHGPLFASLGLPEDVEYIVLGVGRDGKLDLNAQRDVVLIKEPMYETVYRKH